MNDQIKEVLATLRRLTANEQVTWRRTDDPDSFVLARPQGAVTIGKAPGSQDPEYDFVYVRFTDDDGSIAFEFTESHRETDLDKPAQLLWAAVQSQTSEVNKVMNTWLSDLKDLEDEIPF